MTHANVDAFLATEEGRALTAFAATAVRGLTLAGLLEQHDRPVAEAMVVSAILRREAELGTRIGEDYTRAARDDRAAEHALLDQLMAEELIAA